MIDLTYVPIREVEYAEDGETGTRFALWKKGDELRIAMSDDPNATLDSHKGWLKIKLNFDDVANYCARMRELS